jgi:hypothetical protein
MKRASLKSMKVSVLASPSQDVTDRILKTDEGEKTQPVSTPHAEPPPSKPAKPRRAHLVAPTPAEAAPQTSAPLPTATEPTADPLAQAITQTRLALDALNVARDSAPARYNLGIRYRLDSLAHHIEQVAEFVTGHHST